MGNDDGGPQPGFDRWVSFKGQGTYLPTREGLNVDGKKVPQKGYIIGRADRLRARVAEGARQVAAVLRVPVAQGRARRTSCPPTGTRARWRRRDCSRRRARPTRPSRKRCVRAGCATNATAGTVSTTRTTRSWTSRSISSSTPRRCGAWTTASDGVLDYLKSEGLLESTLVIYMGDNGFAFGEHGLIDKRTAYEESMRVPMVMQCPELFPGGEKVEQVVANLDIAPTVLSAAGLQPPSYMLGRQHAAAGAGQDRAVAEGAALRVLLGAELPADADRLRAAGPTGTSSSGTTACGTSTSCST